MDLIENMATSEIAILRDRAHIPTKKSLLELTSQDVVRQVASDILRRGG